MEYKRTGNTIYLRLTKGEEIVESLKEIANKENVRAASVSGIGATDDFTVGVFNVDTQRYEDFTFHGNHEINALVGNISYMDGAYAHVHITCTGKDCKVVGGHLLRAVISLTAEIVLTVSDVEIGRKRDDTLGINLWRF